jgi:transcriptional regulator with XRE-family HTH domain
MPYSGTSYQPPFVTASVAYGLKRLGEELNQARRRCGLSQHQLARAAGVHQSTISRLENGVLVSMRIVRLAAVIAALDGRLEFGPAALHQSDPTEMPPSADAPLGQSSCCG